MEIIPAQPVVVSRPPMQSAFKRARTGRDGPADGILELPGMKDPCCPPQPCCQPCTTCCLPKRRGRYVQPARPKSYAPIRVYRRPDQAIECCTTYRKSYVPNCTPKPGLIIPPTSLGPACGKFAKDTVNKLSYTWNNMPPPAAIRPCNHDMLGKGPMQEVTTQRHDFVPKPFSKPCIINPRDSIYANPQPLSDKTTNRLSYQPNDCPKTAIIPPRDLIHLPNAPMEDDTTQKRSYGPVPLPVKEDMPWAVKPPYVPPCLRMSGDTIYKKSYIPNNCHPRTPILYPPDKGNILTTCKDFEDNTIYHTSYPGNDGNHKPDPIPPKNNIFLSDQKMERCTVNKLSYLPNPGYRHPDPILPCGHKMLGDGPMQEITTTRHDYVPKPINVVGIMRQYQTIPVSQEPLSDMTTNKLSYLSNNCVPKTPIIPPRNLIERPCGPMEDITTQKLSFPPVVPFAQMDMPWAQKGVYCPPTKKMAGDTIYAMSYDAPGDYIEDGVEYCQCSPCAAPCNPCPPTQPCPPCLA